MDDDVVDAARWVGEWWASALEASGARWLSVHAGPSVPRPWSHLACFAGLGPGEVEADGRKVVGVSQWRGRQGALFQTCAYRLFDPAPLVDLLDPRAHAPEGMGRPWPRTCGPTWSAPRRSPGPRSGRRRCSTAFRAERRMGAWPADAAAGPRRRARPLRSGPALSLARWRGPSWRRGDAVPKRRPLWGGSC